MITLVTQRNNVSVKKNENNLCAMIWRAVQDILNVKSKVYHSLYGCYSVYEMERKNT